MSKSIRVEDDTHEALTALKGEDETFDDLLSRLVTERREAVREGAGRVRHRRQCARVADGHR